MKSVVIKNGECECIYEPRGSHGLEDYMYGYKYRFQLMENLDGKYYRLYPDWNSYYYETCSNRIFSNFFNILT